MATRRRIMAGLSLWGVVAVLACAACSPAPPDRADREGVDLSRVQDGYGPGRKTFRVGAQPSEAVLNSVEDNPHWGDERSFLMVRELGTGPWIYEGDIQLAPGKTYEARVLFHNGARQGSRGADSRGTRARVSIPASVDGRGRVSAFLSSPNAAVPLVWRSLVVTSPVGESVGLRYLPDARLTPRGKKESILPSDIFTERGAPIGCEAADGVLPPDCQGEITFRFAVDQPNFTITQEISRNGANRYGYDVQYAPGDVVDLKMRYQNVGTTQQDNVVLREKLASGMTYVPGSTVMSTKGQWTSVSSDGLIARGVNVGSYGTGGAAYVRMTARLPTADTLDCGFTSTSVVATAETDNGSKSATTDVWIEKKC